VEGLFTHLALRDAASDRRQIDLLKLCRDALAERGIEYILSSILKCHAKSIPPVSDQNNKFL
ncbi:MAG: hypothetical protein J6I98_07900, partial [Clostridia bacterium]|nr:hypothetical protein [Clostridia bacterium]